MRNVLLVSSLVLAAACLEPAEVLTDAGVVPDAAVSPVVDAGTAYTYPGCAEETRLCPRDGTYVCAKTAIARRHAACSAAADCVLVEPEGDPITGCPPAAVNAANQAAFRAELQVEIDRYDAISDCRSSGQCPGGMILDCVEGFCAWVYPPDAGN